MTRSTLRTYERTETYVFLNLRKKAAEDYKFKQRISLTLEETGDLEKSSKKHDDATQDSPVKPHQQKHKSLISVVRILEAICGRSPKYIKHFKCS